MPPHRSYTAGRYAAQKHFDVPTSIQDTTFGYCIVGIEFQFIGIPLWSIEALGVVEGFVLAPGKKRDRDRDRKKQDDRQGRG